MAEHKILILGDVGSNPTSSAMFKVGDRVITTEDFFNMGCVSGSVTEVIDDPDEDDLMFKVKLDRGYPEVDEDLWYFEPDELRHLFNGVQRMIECL